MQELKPKSVKTIGLVIIFFSFFIMLSNLGGMFAWSSMENVTFSTDEDFRYINFIFNNYVKICAIMLAIGSLFMISGIYFRKYELWAWKLLFAISIILIIAIWLIMLLLATYVSQVSGLWFFVVGCIINAIIWSTPLILLIRYLRKNEIRKHFG